MCDPEPCTPDDFRAAVTRLPVAYPAPHYVIFTADPEPETGISWCPDCARALPVARKLVAAKGGTLLEVNVGNRHAWKSPDHPYRHEQDLKLTGVPTIFEWAAEAGPVRRLGPELESASTEKEAEMLISNFLDDQAFG